MSSIQSVLRASVPAVVALGCLATPASGQMFILPTMYSEDYDLIPFGSDQVVTLHQVYSWGKFATMEPIRITDIGFASDPDRQGEQVLLDVVIRMGYTDRYPGGLSTNLSENPVGRMTEVYRVTDRGHTNASTGPFDFDLMFPLDTIFEYLPGSSSNLLIELEVTSRGVRGDSAQSLGPRAGDEASRAWNSTRFGNAADPLFASRTLFEIIWPGVAIGLRGECPGEVTIGWEEAAPDRNAALIFGRERGRERVPLGRRCEGAMLRLGPADLQLVRTFNTGPEGRGRMVGVATPNACGGFLQVIVDDGRPCDTSNLVQLR